MRVKRSSVVTRILITTLLVLQTMPFAHASSNTLLAERACSVSQQTGVSKDRMALLSKGVNLNEWLEKWPPKPRDASLLAKLFDLGFTHVRLPVNVEYLMGGFSTNVAEEEFFKELDSVLDQLLGLGFAVSLDVHPGREFRELQKSEPEVVFSKLKNVWSVLAERYALYPPERLFFEILNEPNALRRQWQQQAQELIKLIRGKAPHHTLIVGSVNYQRIDELKFLEPFDDPNIVYAVHFYDLMIFSHQGLYWDKKSPWQYFEGVRFPLKRNDPRLHPLRDKLKNARKANKSEPLKMALKELYNAMQRSWTAKDIEREFSTAATWATKHRRPVIVNEFGAMRDTAAPQDRAKWLHAVRVAAEKFCIGWTHWELDKAFGFVRTENGRHQIDPAIIEALVGNSP